MIDKFIQIYYCLGMNLDVLPKEVLQEVLLLEQQKKRLETRELAQTKFLAYAKHVYEGFIEGRHHRCLLYTSPSPRDRTRSRMPSSA